VAGDAGALLLNAVRALGGVFTWVTDVTWVATTVPKPPRAPYIAGAIAFPVLLAAELRFGEKVSLKQLISDQAGTVCGPPAKRSYCHKSSVVLTLSRRDVAVAFSMPVASCDLAKQGAATLSKLARENELLLDRIRNLGGIFASVSNATWVAWAVVGACSDDAKQFNWTEKFRELLIPLLVVVLLLLLGVAEYSYGCIRHAVINACSEMFSFLEKEVQAGLNARTVTTEMAGLPSMGVNSVLDVDKHPTGIYECDVCGKDHASYSAAMRCEEQHARDSAAGRPHDRYCVICGTEFPGGVQQTELLVHYTHCIRRQSDAAKAAWGWICDHCGEGMPSKEVAGLHESSCAESNFGGVKSKVFQCTTKCHVIHPWSPPAATMDGKSIPDARQPRTGVCQSLRTAMADRKKLATLDLDSTQQQQGELTLDETQASKEEKELRRLVDMELEQEARQRETKSAFTQRRRQVRSRVGSNSPPVEADHDASNDTVPHNYKWRNPALVESWMRAAHAEEDGTGFECQACGRRFDRNEAYVAHVVRCLRQVQRGPEGSPSSASPGFTPQPVAGVRGGCGYGCDVCGTSFPDFDSAAACEARHEARIVASPSGRRRRQKKPGVGTGP